MVTIDQAHQQFINELAAANPDFTSSDINYHAGNAIDLFVTATGNEPFAEVSSQATVDNMVDYLLSAYDPTSY